MKSPTQGSSQNRTPISGPVVSEPTSSSETAVYQMKSTGMGMTVTKDKGSAEQASAVKDSNKTNIDLQAAQTETAEKDLSMLDHLASFLQKENLENEKIEQKPKKFKNSL